jgi:hypothetical protein
MYNASQALVAGQQGVEKQKLVSTTVQTFQQSTQAEKSSVSTAK